MSRVVAFRRFIELRFEDDAGAPVTAFETAPTPAARAAMARNLLIFRPRPSGFALFYRINLGAGPTLPGAIAARIRLSFTLRLRDPGFFDRHHPDLTEATGAGLHLDNLAPDGAILPDGAVLSATATVGAADAAALAPLRAPVTLRLAGAPPTEVEARREVGGALAATAEIHAEPGAEAASAVLDLTAAGPGVYRLATVPPSALQRRLHVDDAALAGGGVGVVELRWETPQTAVPAPAGIVHRVVFARR